MITTWLGSSQSYEPVANMLKMESSGKVLDLAMANKDLMTRLSHQGDEDFRMGAPLLEVVSGVAVVTASGSLVASYKWYNSYFDAVSYEEIRDAIQLATETEGVKSILLHVNSGGGTPTYLDELSQYIKLVDKNIMPVYGYSSSGALSAGYWLISSCRKVSCAKMASAGSIGVIVTLVNTSKMYERHGIEFKYYRSGKFKAVVQAEEEITPEVDTYLNEVVSQLHEFFESHVLASRGSLAQQHKGQWTEGKSYFAKEALSLGLIDEIITFDAQLSKLYDTNKKFSFSDKSTEQLTKLEAIAMKTKLLTADQLAKLSSGVPLDKLGLSEADLKTIRDESQTETTAEDGEVEAEASETPAETPEKETAKPTAQSFDIDKIIKLSTDLANANAELKSVNSQLSDATAKLAAAEETTASMSALQDKLKLALGEAANRFNLLLGTGDTDFTTMSAEATLAKYTDSKSKVYGILKDGATSTQPVGPRAEDTNPAQAPGQHEIIKKSKK